VHFVTRHVPHTTELAKTAASGTAAEAPREWAIEADAIHFAYPHTAEALAGLTFRAAKGEMVAVMGPNGAGKTTLMKILLRLLRPQKGQVRLGTADIAGFQPAELYRRVGMVLQNPADQLFGTTVEQDVAFGPRNLGLPEAEIAERIEAALTAVDALPLRSRPVHRLSFGEQKRVCLAGVLAMRPEILVLDEPIAGLDPAGEARMIELLLRLHREQRATIILSTHSVDLLPVIADRIYVLCGGRVEREGPPREIFRDLAMLDRAGLRLPLVAQLFHGLPGRDGRAEEELPLTIDEARRLLLRWMSAGDEGDKPK
jgi:cobalt/nickel transport system ATP-binding protein